MQNTERILHLDICDYRKRKICPLYSSNTDVSGQAVDIFRTTERNGWKELSFTLPSTCMTDHGVEDNYRLEHLKADFLIRAIDDKETDWYIISLPKIKHNAYSKNVQVTAGHVSQLLKLKNLGLEFSDDKGNNVGTAEELLTTILAGTGWTVGYVYPFAEKNGDPKKRSLKASAKTGAFKLISMMCNLFDAKPIYHGDSRTVDIVPLNPFSEPAPGELPDLSLAHDVVELHYGKNVNNVERAENTDNIVTKLYAYGAYGDKTSGYCGIDECVHTEYTYMITEDCHAGETYYFSFEDVSGIQLVYHFTPCVDIALGSRLIYSLMDPSSMLYIWDDNHQNAYSVYKGTKGIQLPATSAKDEDVKNWFQFVMNFDYYRSVGLMTDEMIQQLGKYQRNAPKLYQDAADASLAMSEAQTILSETIGYIDFCKLHVDREEQLLGDGYTALILDKSTYSDGVIYRSDYDKNKDNRFKWRITESLNTDGDPINSAAGLIYVVHDTNPVSWDKAYLKAIDNEDDPKMLTLWASSGSMNINADTDQFFLFSYNGINGHLGTLETNDESAVMSLEEALRVVTVDHPVVFTQNDPIQHSIDEFNGYGWLWKYNLNGFDSEMYFAYTDEGDTSWNFVYFQDSDPGGAEERSYWFDWRSSVLYRRVNSVWTQLDTYAEKKIAALFATVFMFGKARDRYYQGISENYTYTVPSDTTLPAGNYFFENEYNSYWAFTTTQELQSGDTLTYNYDNAWITQIRNGVESSLKPKGYRFDNVNYHPSNILDGKGFEAGFIGENGALSDNTNACRSQSFIDVVPLTEYQVDSSTSLQIHFYDDKQGWIGSQPADNKFTTPGGCMYIRVCANVPAGTLDGAVISASNASLTIIIEDLNYVKLDAVPHGDNIGLISCVAKFAEYANETYDRCYGNLKIAQDAIVREEEEFMLALGDVYREGWWNDASYVDGDEEKLYEDALDNLNQIAKPEATYNITYLDTREANVDNYDYGASDETMSVSWPDLSDMDAVHLVDPELTINAWAFLDKIQKCHDKPWQTKIVINTNLSTIAQHSFTDVMTNIATVASDMKGKASYYDKTIQSAVTGEDVVQVNANLVKNEKELLSAVSRVEELNGTVITHSSQIRQTSSEIAAEVKRATDQDAQLSSEIKITAEGIRSVVQQDTTSEDNNLYKGSNLQTSIEQTAKDITSIVTMDNKDGSAYKNTMLQQTLDGFSVEITGKDKDGNPATNSLKATVDGTTSRVQTIENTSIIKQTASEIQAVVRNNPNNENEFNTSSVSISKDGVAISTDGAFSVSAGDDEESSAVVIDRNGVAIGSSGVLTVQTDNFGVTPDGKISANDAVINGQISNNGYPVLSKNYDIYIGSDPPASNTIHTGMIWIKPGVPSSGGGTTEDVNVPTNSPTNSTPVKFTQNGTFGKHIFFTSAQSGSGPQMFTMSSDIYAAGTKPTYTYTASVPLYIGANPNGTKTGGIVKLTLNGCIEMTYTLRYSVDESKTSKTPTLTMSTTSSVWLGDQSTITAKLSVSQPSSDYKTGQFATDMSKQITVTCA